MTPVCLLLGAAVDRAAVGGRSGGWLSAHLDRCPACRSRYASQQRALTLIRSAATPRPSEEFLDGVWERVAKTPQPVGANHRPLLVSAAALGALAVVLVAVRPQTGPQPPLEARGPKNPSPVISAPTPSQPRPERSASGAPIHRLPAAKAAAKAVPDEEYLNGEDAHLWQPAEAKAQLPAGVHLSEVRDDFVAVPLPRIVDSRKDGKALAPAVSEYEKEASIVDSRLFRKVTLQLKAASLEEVCAELEKQTGVRLRSSRGVRDEKATLFVKEMPARDLMRRIARLFGFVWARTGAENAYEYELQQSLKARLLEEQLRNEDVNAALLALDEEMAAYRPYLNLTLEQLHARLRKASGEEKKRLETLIEHGGWGAARLYAELSPSERLALISGQQLQATAGKDEGVRRLPAEWKAHILGSKSEPFTIGVGKPSIEGQGIQLAEYAGATPASVALRLERSELGVFTLESQTIVNIPVHREVSGRTFDFDFPYHMWAKLAVGRSPSAASPDNARANAALRKDPGFARQVSLRPAAAPRVTVNLPERARDPNDGPRLTTAEFWEAVHHETGMPVIADYFTRVYPLEPATASRVSLFDALCQACDSLGVRWSKDGGPLMGRGSSYLWDKLKEIPKPDLVRWSADRVKNGSLPAADFLEIASLSDTQLDSSSLRQGMAYLWGLQEPQILWLTPSHMWTPRATVRSFARFIAGLSPEQRSAAIEKDGLTWSALTPRQRQGVLELLPPEAVSKTDPELLPTLRIRASYAPAGWYAWAPLEGYPPRGSGPTPEAAVRAAQKYDPKATLDGTHLSDVNFAVYVSIADRLRSEYLTARDGSGGHWGGRSF